MFDPENREETPFISRILARSGSKLTTDFDPAHLRYVFVHRAAFLDLPLLPNLSDLKREPLCMFLPYGKCEGAWNNHRGVLFPEGWLCVREVVVTLTI